VNTSKKVLGAGGSGLLIFILIKAIVSYLGYQSQDIEQRNLQATYEAGKAVFEATEAVCHTWSNAESYVGDYTCIRGPVWKVSDDQSEFIISLGNGLQSAIFGNFIYVNAVSEKYTWPGINKGDCLFIWGKVAKTDDDNIFRLEIDGTKDIARVVGGCNIPGTQYMPIGN
jgi:hypothetical protein